MIKIQILLFIILILSEYAFSVIPKPNPHACFKPQNPICQNIIQLNGKLDPEYALKISDSFLRIARKHKLPVHLLIAIAAQESQFKIDAVRKVYGLTLINGKYVPGDVGSDFCMMQLNAANIVKFKFDVHRLLSDPDYCLEGAAQILNSARQFANKEETWWTRYNAVSKVHRKIYMDYVLKHWRKLDPAIDSKMSSGK